MDGAAAAPQIGADLGDDIVLPFRTVRSRRDRAARAARPRRRRDPRRATTSRAGSAGAGRGGGADGDARHGAENRRQADRADQDRRPARLPRRQLRDAGARAWLCALRARSAWPARPARPHRRRARCSAAGTSPSPSIPARRWSATRASSRSKASGLGRSRAGLLPPVGAAADVHASRGGAPLSSGESGTPGAGNGARAA